VVATIVLEDVQENHNYPHFSGVRDSSRALASAYLHMASPDAHKAQQQQQQDTASASAAAPSKDDPVPCPSTPHRLCSPLASPRRLRSVLTGSVLGKADFRRALVGAHQSEATAELLAARFREADVDGDGDVGFAEFVYGVCRWVGLDDLDEEQ
jgi:hypothetical protein